MIASTAGRKSKVKSQKSRIHPPLTPPRRGSQKFLITKLSISYWIDPKISEDIPITYYLLPIT